MACDWAVQVDARIWDWNEIDPEDLVYNADSGDEDLVLGLGDEMDSLSSSGTGSPDVAPPPDDSDNIRTSAPKYQHEP